MSYDMWQDRHSTKTYDEFLNKTRTFDTSQYGKYLMLALQYSHYLKFTVDIIDCQFVVTDDKHDTYDLTYHYCIESFKQLCSLIERINTLSKDNPLEIK